MFTNLIKKLEKIDGRIESLERNLRKIFGKI